MIAVKQPEKHSVFSKAEAIRHKDTPASALIDQWYSDIGLWQGLPVERMFRMASALNITPYDIGRLLCIYAPTNGSQSPSSRLFSDIVRSGVLPPHIALNIAVLEAWHAQHFLKKTIKPVIPIHLIA